MYNYNMKLSGTSPYDRIAAEYDDLFGDLNPYYQSVNHCERELFDKWIRRPDQRQLALDVGCGTGYHTRWLADCGFLTTGIDNSKEMIDIARTKSLEWPGLTDFKVMDVNDLQQIPDKRYKVVLCLGSALNHFEDWRRVANLIAERLAPGGMFLFSYDNIDGIDVIARVLLRQCAGYTDAYVRDILFGRVKARITGESFNNHWRVRTSLAEIPVPLKYEHTTKWRRFLKEANLDVCELRGTHVLDCFDRGLLQASAGMNATGSDNCYGSFRKLLRTVDHLLARHLYRIAAHIVGIAVKNP